MTVGIDGGALSITDDRLKVGVYRVAYNLIREIARMDVKNNYRIYTFGGGGEGIPSQDNERIRLIRLFSPGYRKIWQPMDMAVNRIDAYLGISQAFPLTLYDVKKIGFIYDVGFIEHPEQYRESYYTLTDQTADVVARSDHIITISQASLESIHRVFRVPRSKMTVAYLGVEDVFRRDGPKHIRQHPYFLFVGALKPGKNVPMMLRGFAEFLKESREPYDFVLAGSDYWIDPGISATVYALGLQKRVHMAGFIDDALLASYYRGATALLNVSLIEGFGLPTVEAMSTGCPVISSDTGPFPEVVGNNGIMVGPQDELALAKAMQSVATDKKLRATLVARGLANAKRYDWSAFTRTVLKTAGIDPS